MWEQLSEAIFDRSDEHWMLGGEFNYPLLPSKI